MDVPCARVTGIRNLDPPPPDAIYKFWDIPRHPFSLILGAFYAAVG